MTSMLGPKSFRNIIGETFKIYLKNFLSLSAIVAIVEVITFLLQSIIPEVKLEIPLPLLALIKHPVKWIMYFLALPWMWGALIYAVSEQYLQPTISVRKAYRFAWGRLGDLIVAGLMEFALFFIIYIVADLLSNLFQTTLGYMVCACVMFYFIVRWSFIWPAVMLEGITPIATFKRSSALVKGNWWRICAVMSIFIIVTGVVNAIFKTIPFVGGIFGGILSVPMLAISNVLLYYDLRAKKENYNPEFLAAELGMINNTAPFWTKKSKNKERRK